LHPFFILFTIVPVITYAPADNTLFGKNFSNPFLTTGSTRRTKAEKTQKGTYHQTRQVKQQRGIEPYMGK